MEISFEFRPEKRFVGVNLSDITPQKIVLLFGAASETEIVENPLFVDGLTVHYYNSLKLSFYFNKESLVSIAVAEKNFLLFDTIVFKLREKELINLFSENGFKKHESDTDWGEKQLIFEEAGITVFFDNQLVSEIFIDV